MLPADLSTEQYASVVQGIYLVLAIHQLAGTSSVLVDGQAKDADMNAAFDTTMRHYPWAPV